MKQIFLLAAIVATASAQTTPVLGQAEIQQLEIKLAQNPADRPAQSLLGKNYAFYILGITSLKQYDMVDGADLAKANSAFAAHARSQLSGSSNAGVVGEGGNALWDFSFRIRGYRTLRNISDESSLVNARTLGVAALDRAILLDPADPAWREHRIPMLALRTRMDGDLRIGKSAAYDAVKQDLAVLKGTDRDRMLADAAKLAVNVGALDEAQRYAQELLDSVSKGGWNSGNALFFGNMVMGQVALRRGDKGTARARLLASGKTQGSPQLNSFGPNMSLAKELVEAGDRDAVLAFFELCRPFWKMDRGSLDRWSTQVTAGTMPDFGGNLNY